MFGTISCYGRTHHGSQERILAEPKPNLRERRSSNAQHAVIGGKPKLLDQVRQAIRARHYSHKTEEAYVGWIRRFIFFHNKRHPLEMAEAEVGWFLSNLATNLHVSAATQN